jgi:hypothetical protein
LLLGGCVSLAGNVISWAVKQPAVSLSLLLAGATVLTWIGVGYGLSMLMMGARASVGGVLRFLAVLAAMLAPLAASLGLLLSASAANTPTMALPLLVLIPLSIFLFTFLPGWPVWQAVSPQFLPLSRVWASTRGIRLSLFLVGFAAGAVGRLTPETSPAASFPMALAVATSTALLAVFASLIFSSVSVAAAKWMRGNAT